MVDFIDHHAKFGDTEAASVESKMKVVKVQINDRELYHGKGRSYHKAWKDYTKATRIYVSVTKETIFDNLANRTARPSTLYKKLAVKPALAALGLDPKDCTVTWSQHAGCTMCPCSPGFIVKTKTYSARHCDVWVSVEGEDAALAGGKASRAIEIATQQGVSKPSNAAELIAALLNQ